MFLFLSRFIISNKEEHVIKEPVVEEPVKKKNREKYEHGIVEEMVEVPMTTTHCPQSIGSDQLKEVMANPHRYIEINIITRSRVVDSFYIKSACKTFTYKTLKYNIKEDYIYLIPSRRHFFIPTCFYKEKDADPKPFDKTNTGITGKALSLLYDENLYIDLFSDDPTKYNLFIALFLLANIVLVIAGIYLTFFHTPESKTVIQPARTLQLIRGFLPW